MMTIGPLDPNRLKSGTIRDAYLDGWTVLFLGRLSTGGPWTIDTTKMEGKALAVPTKNVDKLEEVLGLDDCGNIRIVEFKAYQAIAAASPIERGGNCK